MSDKLYDLDPKMQDLFLQLKNQLVPLGINIFLVHGRRTMAEQERLYRQGRQDPGPIVTDVAPGHSAHNYGKAIDIAFRPAGKLRGATWDGPWDQVGAVGKSLGLVWGGDWHHLKDQDHFELPDWKKELA